MKFGSLRSCFTANVQTLPTSRSSKSSIAIGEKGCTSPYDRVFMFTSCHTALQIAHQIRAAIECFLKLRRDVAGSIDQAILTIQRVRVQKSLPTRTTFPMVMKAFCGGTATGLKEQWKIL